MDAQTVRELVEFARASHLEELTWERGGRRVFFRLLPAPTPSASSGTPVLDRGAAPSYRYILSPMVGTLHLSGKDRPPLALEGDEVVVGQKLGMVEAMKVHKDVVSDVSGRLVRLLVGNGKPVEYGQKIFEVEPTHV